MTMLRRWWFWVGCVAAVVTAVAAGVLLWVPQAEQAQPSAGEVRIELDRIDFFVDTNGVEIWVPTITNDSGKKITDAELTFAFDEPGGGFPPVLFDEHAFEDADECGVEDVDEPPECEGIQKIREQQDCEVTGTDDEDGRQGSGVACEGDIPKGASEYELTYNLGNVSLPQDAAKLVGYPDVAVRAELRSHGQVLASAKADVAVEHDPTMVRVGFDIPESIPTDTDGVDLSVTVTNDTGSDISGLKAVVKTSAPLRLSTSMDGCRVGGNELYPEVTCEGIDIPAGESVEITMRAEVVSNYSYFMSETEDKETSFEVTAEDGDGFSATGRASTTVAHAD